MIHDVDFSRTLRDIETIFQINKSNLNFHILTLFLAPEYSQRQDKKNELLFSPIGPQVPSGLIFKVFVTFLQNLLLFVRRAYFNVVVNVQTSGRHRWRWWWVDVDNHTLPCKNWFNKLNLHKFRCHFCRRISFIGLVRNVECPNSPHIVDPQSKKTQINANPWSLVHTSVRMRYLLYISTSVWVLHTPKAGRNSNF